ncbi:hypothetical protein SAMN05421753_104236 [Planctomicrobium piriforme]|uniref:Uncharacterized protein n=2 Tax=Planctomicrobium piriforme TaxID=1576369 RepID=A0A1I3EIB6_9PLAN|nr:hypothetical protein SAMN05421753_104236 [Planctomicrobium piriforme]
MNSEMPAFPALYGQTNGADGLTKREYLAVHLVPYCCPNNNVARSTVARELGIIEEQFVSDVHWPDFICRRAILLADCMLERLSQSVHLQHPEYYDPAHLGC